MEYLNLLPDATRDLWNELKNERLLAESVLIGGTALTLKVGHRISEDLDFSFQSLKLPVTRIGALFKKHSGWERNDNAAAYDEFLIGGGSLHDYQQDFITEEGVKLTFFAEDKPAWPLIAQKNNLTPRVGELAEIFALKALVAQKRSKSRDWFDIYYLIKNHGFTAKDMERAFCVTGNTSGIDRMFHRLCSGIKDARDEGYEALVDNPPTAIELKEFFCEFRDQYEQSKAAEQIALRDTETTKVSHQWVDKNSVRNVEPGAGQGRNWER